VLLLLVKQSKTIKKGAKLPIEKDAKLLMLNDNNEPQEVDFAQLIKGKKVVVFGLPGGVGG
jgi:peroxiredoxin